MKKNQEYLRERVKLAKVYNDEWNYKQMAEVIEITDHAFYNWLNGYYNLSYQKEIELSSLIDDLLTW